MTFGCTNTTYLDSNGNAQGVTIFIATDCEYNTPLPLGKQDPRYAAISINDLVLYDGLSEDFRYGIDEYALPSTEPSWPQDPAVLPTCLRGCLCGYSSASSMPDSVYDYCDCGNLPLVFSYLASLASTAVYTTPTNLSLLAHYNIGYDDFNASITNTNLGRGTLVWVNISEGSNLTIQRGFECFGDYETIADIIDPAQ